jgi:hypothetical protein
MAAKNIVSIVLLLAPLVGNATTPALPEQRLCVGKDSDIVIGTIVDGAGEDCRLTTQAQCSYRNYVRLTIVIKEVLAVGGASSWEPVIPKSNGAVEDVIGKRFDVLAEVQDSPHYPTWSGDGPTNYGLLTGPTSKPLTDKQVQDLFVGKTFIFSIMARTGQRPYYSTVWPVESKTWVLNTVREGNERLCPVIYEPRLP